MLTSARKVVADYCAMHGRAALIAECIVIALAGCTCVVAGGLFVLLEPLP